MGSIYPTFSPICFPSESNDANAELTSNINDLKDKNARLEIQLHNAEARIEHFEVEMNAEMSMLEEKISRLEDKLENKMDVMQLRIDSGPAFTRKRGPRM